jgi:hypothetical protein
MVTETAVHEPESTLGGEFVAGLLGAAIAVGCVLPPLLHLVTGPLGPLIGGFVAANRVQPRARGRVIIACTVGTALAGALAVGARVFVGLVGRSELPKWFPSSGTLGAIVCLAWLYAVGMSAVGTIISGSLARKKNDTRR